MEIKNIYWIVVDSMRAYKGRGDTRYRIEYFDELEKEFFNFKNAYTSAPSTVMSAASMFTGCETIKIARNYSDWKFNLSNIKPIEYYLTKQNFENIPIDNSKRAREMLADLIGKLDYKYFSKGISHSKNWTNQDVLSLFKYSLKKSSSKNKFIMTWYDCRGDKSINNLIKDHITAIKEFGDYQNSIIIINSDHGYPDPKAIQTSNIIGKGHDLIVTEDNIKVPLLIKVPGLSPRTINERVSLIDILPTLSQILNFRLENKVDGFSLLGLLKNENNNQFVNDRFIRTDTRLLLQDGKITSLIHKNCKYVKYHDTKIEELYDLQNDPEELTNVIDQNKYDIIKNVIRDRFINQTKKIFEEQEKFLAKNLEINFSKDNFNEFTNVIFFTNLDPVYIRLIKNFLSNKNKNLEFKIFRTKVFDRKINSEIEIFNIHEINKSVFDNKTLIIVIDEKNYYRILDETFINYSKTLKCKRIFLDFNFEKNNLFFSKWVFPLLKYKNNYYFYKREPSLFFSDLFKLTKIMINQYIFKRKVQTPKGEDIKLQRDRYLISAFHDLDKSELVAHQFFYNNLINWGGTQKTIFSLVDNLKKKEIKSRIITRAFSEQLIHDFKLFDYEIQTLDPKADNKSVIRTLTSFLANLSALVFKKIKNFFRFYLLEFFGFIFSDRIVLNCFFSAFRLRRQLDASCKNSNYFSSFLTKPNLIILFYYNYWIKSKQNIKIIINERNDITKQYLKKNKLLNFFYSKLLNKKKVILLTNSLNTYKFFKKKDLVSEIHYVYNDLDFTENKHYKTKLEFKSLKISCIGRITYQKGQEDLLKILSKIDYIENVKFKFIGRGQHSSKSLDIIRNSKFHFDLTSSTNLDEIYKNSDLIIINSYYEGQSNVILECLQYGKLMLINDRLRDELKEIYGHEIENFICFFSNASDLKKLLNINYFNKNFEKRITSQLSFFQNYNKKFKTISNFYSELK